MTTGEVSSFCSFENRRRGYLDRLEIARALGRVPPKSMTDITTQVSIKHRIGILDLKSARRSKAICIARDEAMWRCRHETTFSYPMIGRFFGGRDHSSAMAAVRRHQARVDRGEA